MKKQSSSFLNLVTLFILLVSQVPAGTVFAAPVDGAAMEAALPLKHGVQASVSVKAPSTSVAPGPQPAPGGSVVEEVSKYKPAASPIEIAQKLQLLGYTIPSYATSRIGDGTSGGGSTGLQIRPITAYNLIVDSNVLSPSSAGPNAATLGAQYCNTTTSDMTDVWAYIGNYDSDNDGTLDEAGDYGPGVYPVFDEGGSSYGYTTGLFDSLWGASNPTNNLLNATGTDTGLTTDAFALKHEGGSLGISDASRYIGDLAAGECRTEYWVVSYPRKAWIGGAWHDVTGDVKPDDDLWLPYFFWGTSDTTGSYPAYVWRPVTMRNEISAMANKIWPNGDNKVPQQYLDAIQQVLGWSTWVPGGGTTAYPGQTVTSQGIWYDFGNVGAGFDNNGDFLPDRNAWVQPVGDVSSYDPGCFRLVRAYGLVIIKLTDGTEKLIPFVDQLYFENIPDENNGAVGLVFYQYVALDGACTAGLTPYQEVASGYDNEKFNADYGAGIPPLQSQKTTIVYEKSGNPTISPAGGTITYNLTFALPEASSSGAMTITVGNPDVDMPLVFEETVPDGMTYEGGSATAIIDSANLPSGASVTRMYSVNSGVDWTTTDPGDTLSTAPDDLVKIQWWFSDALPQQSYTGTDASPSKTVGSRTLKSNDVWATVQFQATIPSSNPPPTITDESCLKFGNAASFVCDEEKTLVSDKYTISGTVFCDDGTGSPASGETCYTTTSSGTLANATWDNYLGEPGMPNVSVSLYYDSDGDGALDTSKDLLVSTMDTLTSYKIVDGRIDTSGNGTVGTEDDLASLNGVEIIDGYVDLSGNGTLGSEDVSGAASNYYGYFAGYPVRQSSLTSQYGALDVDRSGTVNASDVTNLIGRYDFRDMPAGTYFTTIDKYDGDIQDTYGITTVESYKAVLVGGTPPTTPNVYNLNFGFAPPLSIIKKLNTTGTINIGQEVQYTITLRNNLPGGTSVSGGSCSYTFWSTGAHLDDNQTPPDPPGGANANAQFDSATYANITGAPDGAGALTNLSNTPNLLGIYGFTANPDVIAAINGGATIDKVEAVVVGTELINMATTGSMQINTYHDGNGTSSAVATSYTNTSTAVGGTLTGGTFFGNYFPGQVFTAAFDLTAMTDTTPAGSHTWDADDFRYNNLGLQLQVDKGGGSNSGTIAFDAVGVRVTINQPCPNTPQTTLDPVPLHDEFPTDDLDYKFASPPEGSFNESAGTIDWANVGPIPAGSYRQVVVKFEATTATEGGELNTASSIDPKFADGRTANDVADDDPVTISTTTNPGSISGVIFDDTDADGWTFAAACTAGSGATCALDSGDAALQGRKVTLLVCMESTGIPETSAGNNKTCTAAGNGNAWWEYRITYTDANGYYEFTGLPQGFYRVIVSDTGLPTSIQKADPNTATTGTLCATTSACDNASYGDARLDQLTYGAIAATTTTFTNVNFGYTIPATPYNIGDEVYYDWDGDGVRDANEETIVGVTMRLFGSGGSQITTDITAAGTSVPYDYSFAVPNGTYIVRVNTSTFPSGVSLTQTGDPSIDQAGTTCTICDNSVTYTVSGASHYGLDFGYQPVGTLTLGDKVFKDMNGDGIQNSALEAGIPDITVKLLVDLDGDGTWETVKTTETDANGEYEFLVLPNLPSGKSYRIQVDTTDPDLPTDAFGKVFAPTAIGNATYTTVPGDTYTAITVSSGAVTSMTNPAGVTSTTANGFGDDVEADPLNLDADFGFAPLAAIGDTLYWDANNNGTQDTGELGINNITVNLYKFIDSPDGSYTVGETFTDDNSNGQWDIGESYVDTLGNGRYDNTSSKTEYFFTDSDGDGVWDHETFTDDNKNGVWDSGESYTDSNSNGTFTSEPYSTTPSSVTAYKTTSTATDANNQAGKYLFSGLDTDKNGVAYVVVVDTSDANWPSTPTLTGDPSMDGIVCPASSPPAQCDSRDGQTLYPGSIYLGADFGYKPANSLGDTLWIDEDGDGVQDYVDSNNNGVRDYDEPYTEAGIPNITVILYLDPNGNGIRDAGENTAYLTTSTNAEGKYYFTNLVNLNFTVFVDTNDVEWPSGLPKTPGYDPDSVISNGVKVINGYLDIDGDGLTYADGDTGDNYTDFFGSIDVINGLLDMDEDTTTDGDTGDSGTYFGYNVINGYIDIDNDSSTTSDADDDSTNNSQTGVVVSGGVVTSVGGCTTTPGGCDSSTDSDVLALDADFGYRYFGLANISGTVCLEPATSTGSELGVCGEDNTDTSGVDTNEIAYESVTVFLYRLNDTNGNGAIDPGETTTLISTTSTDANGDYSFADIPSGVYYIVAIGAPQSGLNLTSTTSTVNDGGTTGDNDAETTNYVETTTPSGDTLSAYQLINLNVDNTQGDNTVIDRDFAFELKGSYDFGDLPESYSTTLEGNPDGARALIPSTPTLYFGTTETQTNLVDSNGTPTVDASGDGSDEDGVSLITTATENDDGWTQDGVGELQFDIVGSGWLIGWMDFDGDGTFNQANEMVINRAVTSGQDQDLQITTPTSSFAGTTINGSLYVYARFRLFPSKPLLPSLAYAGEASNGEVEDYRFPLSGVITPITLSYFRVQRQGSTVNFEWSTATETGNLGFNLYVEGQDGGLIQINDQLIPSNTIDSMDRQDYTYSLDVGGDTFYIEEVSIVDEKRQHGPFQLDEQYGGLLENEKIDLGALQRDHAAKYKQQQADLKREISIPASAYGGFSLMMSASSIDMPTTLNMKVNQTGINRVSYYTLKNAGLDLNGVLINKIKVTNRGKSVPVYVNGAKGKFGPGGYIEFYGEALDTLYTDTNIYTLQIGQASSKIKVKNAKPNLRKKSTFFYAETLVVENQRVYAEYAPGADPWYDISMLTAEPKTWDIPFQINGLTNSTMAQSLELVVWGATNYPRTNPDHHLQVSVNGTLVADERFDGIVEHTIKVTLPAGVLREGANTLQLTLPKDTGEKYDLVNLDKFSVHYPRAFQAQDGLLEFTAAGKVFKVTNLPNRNAIVYRMTSKGPVRLKNVQVKKENDTYVAIFAGTNKAETYFVSTISTTYMPQLEASRQTVNLDRPAQYLIISHPDFIDGLQPLIQARQAQGLTVSVVDVKDLYSQYTYGIFDPQAISKYISYAAKNLGTQYVLLVGGDTYDYRNYLGKNSLSFVPSLYTKTGRLSAFVPVDPLYADLDKDKIPDLAIGRFPVRTRDELDLMISKTLAYAAKDYGRTAVFASDKYDGVESYKTISIGLAASLPADWTSQSIHMDDMSVAAAQQQLITAMNRGTALVTYTGHSAPTAWSFSRLFLSKHAETLSNAGRPFVAVQWGCFNTYYVDPVNKTLVQSFLFSGDRGAVALMGASTRTDSQSENLLGVLLTPRLVTPGKTIGQALLESKIELANSRPELVDVILGWTLMGDPALVIQP